METSTHKDNSMLREYVRTVADANPTIDPTDQTAVMAALNTYAKTADSEATKARQARNRIIRQLYATGMSAQQLADMLDGMSVRAIYKAISEGK